MDREKNHLWIWTAGTLIGLLLLAATGWFGRSAYRHYQEKHDLAQAQAFLASGDYRNALLSVRQTLLLNPTNVPACRIMAALADLSHSPAVLDWKKRIGEPEPTAENKLLLAAAGLRYQSPPFPLTAQILNELAATATNLANYQVARASLALSTRRLTDAESHFETATRLDPTNRLFALNLAIIRLGASNETKVAQSRAVLDKLRLDANLGVSALRALVVDRLAHRDAAAANDYSTQLLTNAQATLADQLQALGILRQLKSEAFTPRLQVVQRLAATNAPAVAEVAAWMQANDLLADDLQWLMSLPARIQVQQPVRLARANGYLQGGDWPALRDFASKGNWGETEFLRLALVSRAWSQLGVSPVADSNWGAAVNEADRRFGAMTTLLGLAEQWQLPREQEKLLERMVNSVPRERWAQQKLEQLYFISGNTAALNHLYARLFGLFPTEANWKNNLAATTLLLKTNLPQAYQWAAEACAQSPGNPVEASTYAYALHLQGRDQDGLAVLQKLKPAQLEQPSVALYYGILLAATSNDYAAPYLQIARTKGQLLPEEKQLLEEINQTK